MGPCATCKFWVPAFQFMPRMVEGTCQRRAPVAKPYDASGGKWPETHHRAGCGEHEQAADETLVRRAQEWPDAFPKID